MVVRVDRGAAGRLATRILGAGVAHPHDQDLRSQRLEMVSFLQMSLELAHELFLDVQHSPANLADRVVVIATGQLVVRRALIEVRGVTEPDAVKASSARYTVLRGKPGLSL